MNRKDVLDALNEISDERIAKAATPPKRGTGRIYWYSGVAAVLAVAVLLSIFLGPWEKPPISMFDPTTGPTPQTTKPSTGTPPTVTPPNGPVVPTVNPTIPSTQNPNYYTLSAPVYPAQKNAVDVSQEVAGLQYYFTRTMAQFLQSNDNNTAFSPVNLYMALAMLAETTADDTRNEILALLGATDVTKLRQQANAIWNSAYNPGKNPCTLANSLWMQKGAPYNKETTDLLARNYYASVFGNDFTAPKAAEPIAQWIDQETGGLLKEHTGTLCFDPQTIMTLVSTVYLDAEWSKPFEQMFNTEGVFGGAKGWAPCTYMNRHMISDYYSGADFGAVCLSLKDGYKMWFVLPNEGLKPADLLISGDYTKLFLGGEVRKELAQINLSVPKFDIACKQNMIEGLQRLGIQRVFNHGADFSPLTDMDLFVNKVEQATRVNINETGVTAASFVVISGPTSPEPPQLIVNFTLNRPFLFIITNNQDLPLFAGCVNNP